MQKPCLVISTLLALVGTASGQRPHRTAGHSHAKQAADHAGVAERSPENRSSESIPAIGDFSGMYAFLHEGEFVQVTLDTSSRRADGSWPVTGFIARLGDDASDKDLLLDHFFSSGSLTGDDHVTFTTKTIHDVSFDFDGHISRGPAATPQQDGFYILRGTLTRHALDEELMPVNESREVEWKLLAVPDDEQDANQR